jgi:hypothetical protein
LNAQWVFLRSPNDLAGVVVLVDLAAASERDAGRLVDSGFGWSALGAALFEADHRVSYDPEVWCAALVAGFLIQSLIVVRFAPVNGAVCHCVLADEAARVAHDQCWGDCSILIVVSADAAI